MDQALASSRQGHLSKLRRVDCFQAKQSKYAPSGVVENKDPRNKKFSSQPSPLPARTWETTDRNVARTKGSNDD